MAMRGLARPGVENGADQGKNEKNWLRKACSVLSGVFGGVILRLTCYSSAGRSKSACVDAHTCIEGVTEDEKDEPERTGTGLDSREFIYGSGRGRTRCSGDSIRSFADGTESALSMPLSSEDVADSECRENGERCGEKASPRGQMVLSKRHRRAILRLSTVFKKNHGMKLLDVKVRKSSVKIVNIGADKRCIGRVPQSTVTARAVAWVLTKLQCARQKMEAKTVCRKVSDPIKEGGRKEEDDSDDDDDDVILNNEDQEGGEVELCKKRILMGRRCKPLNCSGTLQYDNNGILLPELLP